MLKHPDLTEERNRPLSSPGPAQSGPPTPMSARGGGSSFALGQQALSAALVQEEDDDARSTRSVPWQCVARPTSIFPC